MNETELFEEEHLPKCAKNYYWEKTENLQRTLSLHKRVSKINL